MDAADHFNQGLNYYNAWRLDDARREFTRAIELAPDDAAPYTGRGYVHSLNGDYHAALADFDEAIRLNPTDADAWKGSADARQILGDFARSIRDYSAAIRLNPNDSESFHRRGDAHSSIGDIAGAIADYQRAIALNSSNPISHYLLASELARAKQYAEAIYHYQEALRIDENLDSEVYCFSAWLLATCPDIQRRNPLEAIRLATIACEMNEWCEDQSLGILAAAHAANDDFASAVAWQIRACETAYDDRKEIQHRRLAAYKSGNVDFNSDEP